MNKPASYIYEFGAFRLDLIKRELRRDGEIVSLTPKVFETLRVLVQNRGQVVTKDALMEEVWADAIVEESGLMRNISVLRKALGEQKETIPFIVTVPGQGYRFLADVREVSEDENTLIVHEQMRAKIVIEEHDDAEPDLTPVAAFPPATESFFKRNRAALVGSILALALILGIGGFVWQSAGSKKTAAFQVGSMKRLTNLGNVNNAALSPDGKLFAHSIQEKDGRQSLWLGHVDGSQSVALLPAAEVTFSSIEFAPDGASVFYNLSSAEFEGGAIFKLRVFGGVPEKISENVPGRFAVSPEGKRLAFVRSDRENRKSSLIEFDTTTKTEREIVSRPLNFYFNSPSVAFSPDAGKIAVSAISEETGSASEMFVVFASDGSIKQLTNQAWSSVRALVWAKDGNDLFAVASGKGGAWESQLWRVSAATGAAERIVTDLNVYGNALGVSSNKGELLALQTQHYSNVYLSPSENFSAAKQITFELLGKRSGWSGLDWTPDGRIVFTAFVGASETIWTMDADGKNQKQIIPEGRINNQPSVSADGRFLVFASNRMGSAEIWLANADGSNLRQITTGGNNSQPHISPDGKWIVYRSTADGSGALRRISTAGGETVKLTEKSAGWARFSPDGKFIACTTQIEGKTKIAVLDFEAAQTIKLFDTPRTANFNNGIRWTPDGKAVAYRDWNNGIWRQNLDGGDAVRLENLPQEKLYSFGWSGDGKSFAFTRGTEIRDLVLIGEAKQF